METGDAIGIRITSTDASARMIAIIRKYSGNPVWEIRKNIQEKDCVLLCSYTDRIGLKRIIACYNELKENGIEVEVIEPDNEISTIDFLRNLDNTYDEISDEIDEEC